jgi:hypothetical protein
MRKILTAGERGVTLLMLVHHGAASKSRRHDIAVLRRMTGSGHTEEPLSLTDYR